MVSAPTEADPACKSGDLMPKSKIGVLASFSPAPKILTKPDSQLSSANLLFIPTLLPASALSTARHQGGLHTLAMNMTVTISKPPARKTAACALPSASSASPKTPACGSYSSVKNSKPTANTLRRRGIRATQIPSPRTPKRTHCRGKGTYRPPGNPPATPRNNRRRSRPPPRSQNRPHRGRDIAQSSTLQTPLVASEAGFLIIAFSAWRSLRLCERKK